MRAWVRVLAVLAVGFLMVALTACTQDVVIVATSTPPPTPTAAPASTPVTTPIPTIAATPALPAPAPATAAPPTSTPAPAVAITSAQGGPVRTAPPFATASVTIKGPPNTSCALAYT